MHVQPVAFGVLQVTKGSKIREVRILFDSGATRCFIHEKHAKKLRAKCTKLTEWKTGNGCANVSQIAKMHLMPPELHSDRVTEHNFDIVNTNFGCDIIIGTDLMADLGIDLRFLTQELSWDEATVPFESKDAELGKAHFIKDSEAVSESLDRVKHILDAKHEKTGSTPRWPAFAGTCDIPAFNTEISRDNFCPFCVEVFSLSGGFWSIKMLSQFAFCISANYRIH